MERRIYFLMILLLIFFIGCSDVETNDDIKKDSGIMVDDVKKNGDVCPDWMSTELVDARTDEKFTMRELKEKKILLESFAVWCPTCLKQQKILKENAEPYLALHCMIFTNMFISVTEYPEMLQIQFLPSSRYAPLPFQ